jgi:hypothetical protein
MAGKFKVHQGYPKNKPNLQTNWNKYGISYGIIFYRFLSSPQIIFFEKITKYTIKYQFSTVSAEKPKNYRLSEEGVPHICF